MSRYPTLRSDCSSPALTVSESWNVDEEDSDSETDDYEHIPRMSNAKSPRIFRSHSLRNFHTLQHVESKEGIVSTLSHKQQSNPLIRHCSTVRSTPGPPIPPKPVIKGALSPTEILKNHQAKLPLSLELTNGLYGRDQMTTLSQAERVEALYARRVVCAQINIKMEVYKVPLSSMFSFAPLYTPGNKLKQAMSGYVFPSPGALLRAKPRPDVAVALRGHVGTNDEATVQAKDVLWILGEETPGYVKCLHAITGATKKLQAKSDILFSTDPTQLFLPLSEVVSHLSLPAKVLMKPPTQLPECVTKVKKLHNTQIVEVIRCVEKSSLICCRTVGVDALDVTFSMPQGVDLEMIAVSQTCQHRQALCLKVAKMLSMNYSDRFIDESLHALQTSGKNRSSFDVQLAFLQAVENCHKSSQPICPADAQLHLTASAGNKAVGSSAEVGNQLHILQRECQFLSIDVNDCKQSVRAVSSTINTKVLPETQEVKKMSIQYLESLQEVQSSLDKLEERLTNLEKLMPKDQDYQNVQLHWLTQRQDSLSALTSTEHFTTPSQNIQFLETLPASQIIHLMQCMGLSNYAAIVRDENITGSLLAQLTDDMLEKDLNITSRLHRLRIMDLIQGRTDASAILSQDKSSQS